jgi:hypothetical protein
MIDQIKLNDTIVLSKILIIRGKRVMIDSDLAELYGTTTKRLNEQVRRNLSRFPEDFMFQITEVVANCDHLKKHKFSSNLPKVFTEFGAVMLSSVLNSERAIVVNIQIVRIFTQLRVMLSTNKDILLKLEQMESQVIQNSNEISVIFDAIKELLNPTEKPMNPIGYEI